MSSRHRRAGRRTPRAAVALCALLATMLWPTPAAAAGTPPGRALLVDRLVVDDRGDDSYAFRKLVSLRETRAPRVVARNLAVAHAGCDRCRSVAVAFQIVLAGAAGAGAGTARAGSPRLAVAANRALALNEECAGCRTLALAYQFVVLDQRPVTLSASGRRQLGEIRRALSGLLRAAGPDDVIVAGVAGLASRVRQVLAENLRLRAARAAGRLARGQRV